MTQSYVNWLNCVFSTDYDEIELLKNQLSRYFNDIIVIMSQKHVTKFFYFGPLPIKISGYANDDDKCLASPEIFCPPGCVGLATALFRTRGTNYKIMN